MTTHCKHDIVTFLADKDCLINLRFFRFGARLEVFFWVSSLSHLEVFAFINIYSLKIRMTFDGA